jgi:transposase-like protein
VTVGYDDRGNRRARVTIRTAGLIVVIDEAQGMIITVWME